MRRTFGWVQNPASTDNLKKTVGIFLNGSAVHTELLNVRIPFLLEHGLAADPGFFSRYAETLNTDNIKIPYADLKGKGAGAAGRGNAKCSGLVQAVIPAQKNITVTDSQGRKRNAAPKP